MAKMRTTTRGGRQGKAKHNDRTYLPEDERPRENRYGYVGYSDAPNLTFKQAELVELFYNYFSILLCSSGLQCRSNLFFFFDLNRLDTLISNFDLFFLFAF